MGQLFALVAAGIGTFFSFVSQGSTAQPAQPYESFEIGTEQVVYELSDNSGKMAAYTTYDKIILSDEVSENYPMLSEFVTKTNKANDTDAKDSVEKYVSWRKDDGSSATYFSELTLTAERTDSVIVSIKEYVSDYTGGVHGNQYVGCINVNPVTGEIIKLEDVLKNSSDFAKNVDDSLRAQFGDDYEFLHSPYETISKYDLSKYIWTISEDALYIHFEPYEIASYADGQITAELKFSDYPGLVKSKYTDIG